MVNISFEIGGAIVEFNNAKNSLEKALFQEVREYVKHAVGSVRCPEHGEVPRIACKGPSLSDSHLKYQDVVKSLQIL